MIDKAEFTAEQLVKEVKELAEQNPDFVYSGSDDGGGWCFYTKSIDSQECGCIIGQGILKLQPNLRSYLQQAEAGLIPDVSCLLINLGINYLAESKRLSWLKSVQYSQDRGLSWGDSIHAADIQLNYD